MGDVPGLLSLLQLSECSNRVRVKGAVKTSIGWLILWAGKVCDQVKRAVFKPPSPHSPLHLEDQFTVS